MLDDHSRMTPADRSRILSPESRAIRQRIETVRSMYRPHLATVNAVTPSYVAAAIRALDDAMTRWQLDEHLLDAHTGVPTQ